MGIPNGLQQGHFGFPAKRQKTHTPKKQSKKQKHNQNQKQKQKAKTKTRNKNKKQKTQTKNKKHKQQQHPRSSHQVVQKPFQRPSNIYIYMYIIFVRT